MSVNSHTACAHDSVFNIFFQLAPSACTLFTLRLKQAAKLNNYNKAHVEQLKPQQAATIVAMDGDKLDD